MSLYAEEALQSGGVRNQIVLDGSVFAVTFARPPGQDAARVLACECPERFSRAATFKNENWNAYGQFTYISSSKPSFPALYTNLNGRNEDDFASEVGLPRGR